MYYPKIDYFQKSFKDLWSIKGSRCRWGKRGHFIICEVTVLSNFQEKPYTLCINYEKNWSPRVWIVEPNFLSGTYPHTYAHQSNALCLYSDQLWQWRSRYNIVDTIVCWALAWISYYEYYALFNKWVGPEAPHDVHLSDEHIKNKRRKKKKLQKPRYLKDYPIRY